MLAISPTVGDIGSHFLTSRMSLTTIIKTDIATIGVYAAGAFLQKP